ncbi:MAG TPA: MGMT family protein [Pyrodictium sp.]|nr:MGMT family protein [Pyrodictium sp.]HIQ55925.1 MGMT family protein [Pyrodictium sp.]
MGELDRPYKRKENLIDELVYTIVQLIPIGYTVTYKAIAELLGMHPRRVALALRRNIKPIIVPCHRVVGTRSLGGYTPANVGFKEKLLQLEGALTRSRKLLKRINSAKQLMELIFNCKGRNCIVIDDH